MNTNPNGTVTSSHANQLQNEIRYIEGRDNVYRGEGSLVSLTGGVGTNEFAITIESGVGQDLYRSVYIYGVPNRGN